MLVLVPSNKDEQEMATLRKQQVTYSKASAADFIVYDTQTWVFPQNGNSA